MPEYSPTIHNPIDINLREIDYVKAYTNLDSPTWGNAFRSAIRAGYSPSFARVITHYITKQRIQKVRKNLRNPMIKSLIKSTREQPPPTYMLPSKRFEKRLKTEANRRWKEFLMDLREAGLETD